MQTNTNFQILKLFKHCSLFPSLFPLKSHFNIYSNFLTLNFCSICNARVFIFIYFLFLCFLFRTKLQNSSWPELRPLQECVPNSSATNTVRVAVALHKLSVSWGLRLSFSAKNRVWVCVYPHATRKMGLAANCCENRVSRHNAKCIARKNWKQQPQDTVDGRQRVNEETRQTTRRATRKIGSEHCCAAFPPLASEREGESLPAKEEIPIVVKRGYERKFLHTRGGN